MTVKSETENQRWYRSLYDLFSEQWYQQFTRRALYKRIRRYLPLTTCVQLERFAGRFTGLDRFSGSIRPFGLKASFHGSQAEGFRTARVEQETRGHLADSQTGTAGVIVQAIQPDSSASEISLAISCDVARIPWPVGEQFTPLGFSVALSARFASISTIAHGRPPRDPGGRPASLLHIPDLAALRARPDALRLKLQRFTGLLDHPDNHLDLQLRAAVLSHAAAVGLPVCLNEDRGLRGFLPDAVLDLWLNTTPADLLNPSRRERIAFRQWNTVLDALSMRPAWNRLLTSQGGTGLPCRRISVLLVTKRREMLPFWAQLLAAQNYPDFEVIAGFHGSEFTATDEAEARSWLGDRLTVIRAPGNRVLGEVLNQVTAAASGELVVKWDDDDLYSSGHLSDLARIYEYSGATMVGKALEFMYLAASNTTLRVSLRSSELYGFRMSGNTLCLAREDLLKLGGWQPLPRSVDTRMVHEVVRQGGQLYRGIGFGHLVLRNPNSRHGHTWNLPDRTLFSYGRETRPGADAAFAMVDVPEELVGRWAACRPRQVAAVRRAG